MQIEKNSPTPPTQEISSSRTIQSLEGIPRLEMYGPESSDNLVLFHQVIAGHYHVRRPYFEFTDTGEAPLYHQQLPNGLWLKMGPIGSFSAQEIAGYTQELTANYILQGTMGAKFPKEESSQNQALLGIFIGDFDPRRMIVAVEARSEEGRKPVAGVQAHFGQSKLELDEVIDLVSSNSLATIPPRSSLATLQAFQFDPTIPSVGKFLLKNGEVPELAVFCMSRLFKDPSFNQHASPSKTDMSSIDILAFLALAVAGQTVSDGQPALLGIYDTYATRIQGQLVRELGMSAFADESATKTTPAVVNSILRHHYVPEHGGFTKVFVGQVPLNVLVEKALARLQKQGTQIIFPQLSTYRHALTQQGTAYPEIDLLSPSTAIQVWESLFRNEPQTHSNPDTQFPIIFDHHVPADIQRLKKHLTEFPSLHLEVRPYMTGLEELGELHQSMENTPQTKEGVLDFLVKSLLTLTQGISESELRSLLEANSMVQDIAWLRSQLELHGASPATIERESRLFHDPLSGQYYQYIGEAAHELLTRSRNLGLIPFETLEKLKKLRIVVAGASAVSQFLDLLAAMGANDVTFYDTGYISPSNQSRLNASSAAVAASGEPKVLAQQRAMQGRNPYGHYRGVFGRVIATEAERTRPADMLFRDFVINADYVIEVVDSIKMKQELRVFLMENFPDLPLLFLADVGSDPLVGIEFGREMNPFSQHFTSDEWKTLIELKIESPQSLLTSLYQILRTDIPQDLVMELLALFGGALGFWAQHGISAHETAAIGLKLMLSQLMEKNVAGKNTHSNAAPNTLMPEYSKEHAALINTLVIQLFSIKL